MPKASVYIDGHNVFYAFKERFLWLDLLKVSHRLLERLEGDFELEEVHYFTSDFRSVSVEKGDLQGASAVLPGTEQAVPQGGPSALPGTDRSMAEKGGLQIDPAALSRAERLTHNRKKEEQEIYLAALRAANPSIVIHKGKFKNQLTVCRSCKHEKIVPKEKETDVAMVCQMLYDAYENEINTAFLVTRDSDFIPAISLLKEIGVKVILVPPVSNYDSDLAAAADASFALTLEMCQKCSLPPVIRGGKNSLTRPPEEETDSA